ncbi:MAG: ABC-2 family transporter protein [Candidatus Magasanikbacteria bacterium]
MKKYFRIYKVFVENGISFLVQYRHDTLFNLFMHLVWMGMMFLIVEILFGQTNAIAGWSKQEVYMLTLIWTLIGETYITFFGGNLPEIPDTITDGKLDNLITKPVNTLFLVSTKFFLVRATYRVCTELILIGWLVWQFDFAHSLSAILSCILLTLCGVMIYYASFLIANTFSFWLLRIDNINDAVDTISTFGRYPVSVFPLTIRASIFVFAPIVFASYAPVAVLTGKWPLYTSLFIIAFTIILCVIAVKFWNFAIKRYTSASS